MTALEITHSLTMGEIESLNEQLRPYADEIADSTYTNRTNRTKLVKPMVSFDAQALALSFLPAVPKSGEVVEAAGYTYHHLRRDLFAKVSATGLKVASRYAVPSAHLTIGRFITRKDFDNGDGGVDRQKMENLIATIEEINEWLENEYWPKDSDRGPIKAGGDWMVGEEKGLELRKGDLWYGGGERVILGKGAERGVGDL